MLDTTSTKTDVSMGTKTELTGKKIGRLLVVSEVFGHKHAGKHRKWLCICDCGNKLEVFHGSLTGRNQVSCGCWQKDVVRQRNTTHGKSKTPIYAVWSAMIARCSNPKLKGWEHYGGRGISVCERWNKFENFLADMGEFPYVGAEIDRIDNNGNYSPENCRWATHAEQTNNTRANVVIEINGVTKNVMQWVKESGIPYNTIRNRLKAGKVGADLIAPSQHSGGRKR